MIVQYSCPKDPEIVLFEVDEGRMELIVFKQPPKLCPQCGEYYFKEQCQLATYLRGSDEDEP
jgi:hypothetical protein